MEAYGVWDKKEGKMNKIMIICGVLLLAIVALKYIPTSSHPSVVPTVSPEESAVLKKGKTSQVETVTFSIRPRLAGAK